MKYSLLKSKTTGIRMVRDNVTKKVVSEADSPKEYMELRKKALRNLRQSEFSSTMRDLGLKQVRGAVSGKVYWE